MKNKYQNTLLRLLNSSVMRYDIDPDMFLSNVFQLRDKLNDLDEVVTDERLTTIILDALPEEMYSTVKMQSVKDPELGLEEIVSMTKTIFINHSERSSVPKRSQELYRKVQNNGREPKSDQGRKPGMTFTCYSCKNPGHKIKDCKQ